MRVVEVPNPPQLNQMIQQFTAREHSFVLDSAQSNDGLGEWSFLGADPFLIVSGFSEKDQVLSTSTGFELPAQSDLKGLDLLRSVMAPHQASVADAGIPFCGGAVGYLAYDYGRRLEQVPDRAEDDRRIPDYHFGLYDGIVAINHKTGQVYVVALGIRGPEEQIVEELMEVLQNKVLVSSSRGWQNSKIGAWEWNFTQAQFEDAVDRVRQYIASGDVYQVNLSQRARARFDGNPAALYCALRAGNPAPYGAYLDLGGWQLLSTSPEQFIRKQGRLLETRPIKGTRPRGETPEADADYAAELKQSTKDRAELLMIVDLERNDLGRVSEFGSVKVADLYHLEYYARVIHQTARVQGVLRSDANVFQCIEALFPGGSITGAPKIRAMEIIEELEPTRRGAYCGSIGYIGFNEDAEFNIAIRSLHLKDGYLDYQVGSGIVWDSKPAEEYAETLDKARAIRDVLDRWPNEVFL